MVTEKTTGLSEAEAVAKIQELAAKEAVKIEESHIKLSDVFRDKTTGKITLPKITPRGTALLELAASSVKEDENVTSIEQMLMVVWALKNQSGSDAKRALRLKADAVRDEVDSLFDKLDMTEIEDYASAVEEAISVFDEETPKGNPRKGKARRKKKATAQSGS